MKETKMNPLKISVYTFVTALLFTATASANASIGGGQGSGGGNIRPATPTEIRAVIREIWPEHQLVQTTPMFDSFNNLAVWKKEVADPAVRTMWPRVFGAESGNLTYPVSRVLSRVIVDIKDNEPCFHEGLQKASSIEQNSLGDINTLTIFPEQNPERNATICFSVKKFENIPKYALKDLIVAISAHELMHLLNFSEAPAIRMEQFFLDNKGLITWDFVHSAAQSSVSDVANQQSNLANLIVRSTSDLAVCASVGLLTAAAQNAFQAIEAASQPNKRDRPFIIRPETTLVAAEVLVMAESAKGFCGTKPLINNYQEIHWGSKYPVVALTDRAALAARLREMPPKLQQLKKMTGSDLFY